MSDYPTTVRFTGSCFVSSYPAPFAYYDALAGYYPVRPMWNGSSGSFGFWPGHGRSYDPDCPSCAERRQKWAEGEAEFQRKRQEFVAEERERERIAYDKALPGRLAKLTAELPAFAAQPRARGIGDPMRAA